MTNQLSQKITDSLKTLRDARSLREGSKKLFNSLGYHSQRTEEVGSVSEFLEIFDSNKSITTKRRALFDHWRSVDIVFQITDSEINVPQHQHRRSIFSDLEFDRGRVKSFLFLAVEMQSGTYSRTCLANTTRAVNLIFKMPVIVLFRHGTTLTLAAVQRRMNKRDNERDVLEKVTLIKDIRMGEPHRAHIDILSELELTNLIDSGIRNFGKLHERWEQKLDIETLNKRFYKELFNWFQRAVEECKFPDDGAGSGYEERHVIRLITRLLFIWFLKEKGLVPEKLFDESFAHSTVRDHSSKSTNYYRVVLQNLFFATLNTEINLRSFGEGTEDQSSNHFHYHDLIRDPDALLEKLNLVPFVNGGLFDCLDDFDTDSSDRRLVDCFTDNSSDREGLQIPAHLFFDNQYGLFTLFNKYKFTVEESTPLDQEVALDPELLGRVFENLLAAYNPETSKTVRKTTGSFYTPRPIVDYMVREAVVEALVANSHPSDGDSEFWRERLSYLLDYSDAMEDIDEIFEESEKQSVVTAISKIRAIDPAAGSGAFPMGILQTLTLTLRRLDRNNEFWEQVQKEDPQSRAVIAFDTQNQLHREEKLREISTIFEKYRDSDFGRKLYLIENCIYGVDIQPIACQIAKLRFFISLIIHQEANPNESNFGIKPLPNLETRFVAANSLLRLPKQRSLHTEGVEKLEEELKQNRKRHFHTSRSANKLATQKEDEKLRIELANELQKLGCELDDSAQKIASWNPYDQNRSAGWFDPKYMFGVSSGFDIVIGNPPYIRLRCVENQLKEQYKAERYQSTGDVYCLFYERGCELLKSGVGVMVYISSNSWLKANYGRNLRSYFTNQHTPRLLIELGKEVFDNAIVDTAVLMIRSGKHQSLECRASEIKQKLGHRLPPSKDNWNTLSTDREQPWIILSSVEQAIMEKINSAGKQIREWDVTINCGIVTGLNEAFYVDTQTQEQLIREDPASTDLLQPILKGRDICRYQINWGGLWVISTFPSLNINIEDYPAIKQHLLSFGKDRLKQDAHTLPDGSKSRGKTPNAWYEHSSNCAYDVHFKNAQVNCLKTEEQSEEENSHFY